MKKVFLKISKSSQENACARVSFLIKLQAHLFFIIHIRWLLLVIVIFTVYESEAFNNSLQNLTAYLCCSIQAMEIILMLNTPVKFRNLQI